MFLGEATLSKWFCLPSEKWSPIGRISFLLQQTLFHKGIANWCAEKQTKSNINIKHGGKFNKCNQCTYPVSILRKSIPGRHRPVRVADGPMMARCRFT